jgi:hypothetical protein
MCGMGYMFHLWTSKHQALPMLVEVCVYSCAACSSYKLLQHRFWWKISKHTALLSLNSHQILPIRSACFPHLDTLVLNSHGPGMGHLQMALHPHMCASTPVVRTICRRNAAQVQERYEGKGTFSNTCVMSSRRSAAMNWLSAITSMTWMGGVFS